MIPRRKVKVANVEHRTRNRTVARKALIPGESLKHLFGISDSDFSVLGLGRFGISTTKRDTCRRQNQNKVMFFGILSPKILPAAVMRCTC